jgi:hypothetical protein
LLVTAEPEALSLSVWPQRTVAEIGLAPAAGIPLKDRRSTYGLRGLYRGSRWWTRGKMMARRHQISAQDPAADQAASGAVLLRACGCPFGGLLGGLLLLSAP